MSSPAVSVSAPGKVLFAGGFLVLDRQHTGLVFGLNARIHVVIQPWDDRPDGLEGQHVLVQSPQFKDARWLYNIGKMERAQKRTAVEVRQVVDQDAIGFTTSPNKFVETTLRYVLTYLSQLSDGSLSFDSRNVKVTILADDDYYSQSQPSTNALAQAEASGEAPRTSTFTDFGVKLTDAHKTGLGSSAALVTSLVTALLAHYTNDKTLDHRKIHNLAQAAHCAAQGKVGSGFDVAAAVYGSCLYRRFTPTILENVGEAVHPDFGERLRRCVDDLELKAKWDVEVASQAVQIPESLLLVMCDVDCGSETPGMVRKVLQWRKEKPEEAELLWNALQQGQEDLCRELKRLSDVKDVEHDFTALGDTISTIRSLVREMSSKSDVPVEPPVITELLDFCTSLPGVVGGVAPGAGGYDAVALLMRNDTAVVQELQKTLEGWKSRDETGATIGKVRLLGVKQEHEGVRTEEGARYQAWL